MCLRFRRVLLCRPVTDMRLALLRHWTLYEALLYANYVAVRMHTYNDAGRNKMEDLLVNMGVPLAQSKHSYSAPQPLLPPALPMSPRHQTLTKPVQLF